MLTAFSKLERDELLRRHAESMRRYEELETRDEALMKDVDGDLIEDIAAESHLRAADQLEREYFHRVPRPVVSCCPFDEKPLIRTFDPFGFDGLWWRSDATPEEVPSCPHFCCLRGAVNFNGHKPRGGDFEAHIGPEVPYVIPRILDKPGMLAVISQLDMGPGHIVYLIAYFAQRRPPVQDLAADWPRTIFVYTTALAERRWRTDDGAWDFDLKSWIERGKIRWCAPGDNATLGGGPGSPCPYLDVKGERQRMVVQRDQVWGLGLPSDGGAAHSSR